MEAASARVRRLHASLRGYDPDTGETFALDEPELLLWVHSTEIDSYAEVARRGGILNVYDRPTDLLERPALNPNWW